MVIVCTTWMNVMPLKGNTFVKLAKMILSMLFTSLPQFLKIIK